MLNQADNVPSAGERGAAVNSIMKPKLHPLSYEGLRSTFAQPAGSVTVGWTRAGYPAPDVLCRTCAVGELPNPHPEHTAPIVTARAAGSRAGDRRTTW